MGERREGNPNKRMLFTEFESPGGRPDASAVDARSRRPVLAAALPSMEELASSLGIDFEDDPDSSLSRASAAKRNEDDDRSGSITARLPSALHAPPPSTEKDEPEETRPFEYAPFVQEAFANLGDGSAEAEDGGADMDFDDILSAISPPFMGDADDEPAMMWRGQRLGVKPPPSVPYGGIERVDEWYRPPERKEGAGDAAFPEEPPPFAEPPADAEPANRGSASAIFSDLDLESIWKERTASASGRSGDQADSGGGDKAGARINVSGKVRDETTIVMPAAHKARSRIDSETKREIRELAEEKRGTETSAHQSPVSGERASGQPPERDAKRGMTKPYRRPASSIDVGGHGFLEDDASESASIAAPENVDAASGGDADAMAGASPGADAATAASRADVVGETGSVGDGQGGGRSGGRSGTKRDESGPAFGVLSSEILPDASGPENDDEYLPEAEQDADVEMARGRDDSAAYLAESAAAVPIESGVATPVIGAADHAALNREGDGGSEPFDEAAAIPSGGSGTATPAGTAALQTPPSSGAEVQADGAAIGSDGQVESIGETAAVNPEDVFANFDDMDFEDDGLDDEMKAILDDGDGQKEAAAEQEPPPEPMSKRDAPPTDAVGKIVYRVKKMLFGVIPAGFVKKTAVTIAWRENWWFYLDLLAAIIASASLAIIISYFIWYRK